jgi:hypothetical protein
MDLHRRTATRTSTGDETKKRPARKPVRGVFEHPAGSDIWWVNYYVAGRRHREKVGTRGKAVALYQKRKSDARAGIKLPESLRVKRLSCSVTSRKTLWCTRRHTSAAIAEI